jgi:hypothetical protein
MRELGTFSDEFWDGSGCTVPGCDRSMCGGRDGMCVECAGMDSQYEGWYSEQHRAKRVRIGRRLRTAALVALFLVLMNWLAVEAAPRIWLAFKVWGK